MPKIVETWLADVRFGKESLSVLVVAEDFDTANGILKREYPEGRVVKLEAHYVNVVLV